MLQSTCIDYNQNFVSLGNEVGRTINDVLITNVSLVYLLLNTCSRLCSAGTCKIILTVLELIVKLGINTLIIS